jgi:uncharacterized protein YeaO (DUF488 family)
MPVFGKSIYDPAAPADGLRVLTTNYWPRGISRERAGVYKRVLAPSRALLRAFKDGAIDWPAYRAAYLEEMRGPEQRAEIDALARAAQDGAVTVMCTCREDAQCHRALLRALVADRVGAPA